jgi:C-terminal processing protease CtpA/Prc
VGSFVSRKESQPIELKAEDINGSQSVPLIVLVDRDTHAMAEVFSMILRAAGRARIVGGVTAGDLALTEAFDLLDHSQAGFPTTTFVLKGQEASGVAQTGIQPDVLLPTRWDLFNDANDPAIAEAIRLLQQK